MTIIQKTKVTQVSDRSKILGLQKELRQLRDLNVQKDETIALLTEKIEAMQLQMKQDNKATITNAWGGRRSASDLAAIDAGWPSRKIANLLIGKMIDPPSFKEFMECGTISFQDLKLIVSRLHKIDIQTASEICDGLNRG
jgi:hypothetical protein